MHVTWKLTSITLIHGKHIDEKTTGPRRFNRPIGKQVQDFEFFRLKTTAMFHVTWDLALATETSATRKFVNNISASQSKVCAVTHASANG